MSLFSRENAGFRKCMAIVGLAGLLLYFAGIAYGNGFLSGFLISVILYESNVSYWNKVADIGKAHAGTGLLHFLLHYALMAGVMIFAVFHPGIMNIFTAALGLLSVKIALIVHELTKRKESI